MKKPECFAVRRGEIDLRHDAKYFALRKSFRWGYPIVPLGSLVANDPSYGSPSRAIPMTSTADPRYIRITDFNELGINPNHEYMTAEDLNDDYRLRLNDILFARSGATVGKTYIHEDVSKSAIFAGYCIRFQLDPQKVLPKFVFFFTKLRAYKHWVATIQRPAGQPNINKEEYKNLEIPLPPVETQRALVDRMEDILATHGSKLSEANELLAGLDKYVLDTLELRPPQPTGKNSYAIQVSELTNRLDSYSNQSHFRALFKHLHRSQYSVHPLKEIASDIFSGTTPLVSSDAYIEPPNGVRFIRSGEIADDGTILPISEVHIISEIHQEVMRRSQLKKKDILIAIVGATIGAVGVYDSNEQANINQAIAGVRLSSDTVRPEYLCWYLKSSIGQQILDYFKRPVARANINLDEIAQIPVVIPPLKVQESIVGEVINRREQAKNLIAEAEAEWIAAKQWFEEQLLGKSPKSKI